MRRRMALHSTALVIGATACHADATGRETMVRDSAGVRIVETTAGTRFPAPLTVGETTFSVGLVEGEPEYMLHRVVGAMQLPDGEILVANGGSHELRFYDASGRWLRSEGRDGEGPGEYRYMRALGRCRAEGFVAFDLNWQMNAYDDRGRFLRRTNLTAPGGTTPYNMACDREGRIVMIGWGRARAALEGPQIGFYQARDSLVLATPEGRVLAEFGERLVSERIGTATGSRPHPAGRATAFAVHGGMLYVGSGEQFEIELHDLDGTLRAIVRGPGQPPAVTAAIRSAWVEREVARTAPERRQSVREQVSAWEWPETLPAYTAMVVDAQGIAWLRNVSLDPEEPVIWSLLDPERGYLGDVTLGPRQTLLDIGDDHLLVLQRDELGVESVLRLGLVREEER